MRSNLAKLGDVCVITMGQAPIGESYNNDAVGLPLIAGAGDFGLRTPSPKKYTTSPGKVSSVGDIVLCIRATIGDINWSDKPYCLGRGVAGLRAESTKLDQLYLWHFIASNKNELAAKGTGSTFKQVSRVDIAEWIIPLPPLQEQKRIAAILDKADSLRRKRQQALQLADDFLRATFLDLFGDPVTNPKGWPELPVSDIAKVTTGNTPSREVTEYFGDEIEWIKSDNINTPEHWLTAAQEGLSKSGLAVGRAVPAGSILMTCIAGSPSCIGNVAITNRRVAFNQQINALTPLQDTKSEFLYSLLLYSKTRIQSASTNSMKGMISKGALERIQLISPPKSLQDRYVDVFNGALKLTEKMSSFNELPLSESLHMQLIAK